MKLIVGLGNPGKQYENTRHNIGFMSLDYFVKNNKIQFKVESRFEALIAEYTYKGEKVIFAKPITYMNLSGRSVQKIMQYYKIEVNDLLIIHDDLDLETGRIRLREKGSSGGHNGLKSLMECLGTQEFKRVKIGIEKQLDRDIIDYVLGKFSKTEMNLIEPTLEKIEELLKLYIEEPEFKNVMNKFN